MIKQSVAIRSLRNIKTKSREEKIGLQNITRDSGPHTGLVRQVIICRGPSTTLNKLDTLCDVLPRKNYLRERLLVQVKSLTKEDVLLLLESYALARPEHSEAVLSASKYMRLKFIQHADNMKWEGILEKERRSES